MSDTQTKQVTLATYIPEDMGGGARKGWDAMVDAVDQMGDETVSNDKADRVYKRARVGEMLVKYPLMLMNQALKRESLRLREERIRSRTAAETEAETEADE